MLSSWEGQKAKEEVNCHPAPSRWEVDGGTLKGQSGDASELRGSSATRPSLPRICPLSPRLSTSNPSPPQSRTRLHPMPAPPRRTTAAPTSISEPKSTYPPPPQHTCINADNFVFVISWPLSPLSLSGSLQVVSLRLLLSEIQQSFKSLAITVQL